MDFVEGDLYHPISELAPTVESIVLRMYAKNYTIRSLVSFHDVQEGIVVMSLLDETMNR